MDVLHKLVQGTGCSVDGTVSAQNPLTKAINNVLQSKAFHINAIASDTPVIVQQNTNHPVQHTQHVRISGHEHRMKQLEMEKLERNAYMNASLCHHSLESFGRMEAAFQESKMQAIVNVPPSMTQPFQFQNCWVSEFQNLKMNESRVSCTNSQQHELAWQQTQASVKHAEKMEESWIASQEMNVPIDERAATMQTANSIAETLGQNRSSKFQNSQFAHFMSQIGEGTVDLDELSQNKRMDNVWNQSSLQQYDTCESAWRDTIDESAVLLEQESRFHKARVDAERVDVESQRLEDAWNSQQPDSLVWQNIFHSAILETLNI